MSMNPETRKRYDEAKRFSDVPYAGLSEEAINLNKRLMASYLEAVQGGNPQRIVETRARCRWFAGLSAAERDEVARTHALP